MVEPHIRYTQTKDTARVPFPVPAVVLIFGANCTGKSSLGRALAGRVEQCAFIEVDELRYKVVGGLVAYSAADKPWEHPEEAARQLRLGLQNAVRLARGFAEEGFSSVIDGVEREYVPGSGWADAHFRGLNVFHIVVTCDEATLAERWNLTDWPDNAAWRSVLKEREWYRANEALFDGVVDTTGTSTDAAADAIANQVLRGRSGRASP